MKEDRIGARRAPCIFHVVFCAGRSLEAYAVFVAAAFFTEYNAPVVLTSFFVTLGAGVLLSLLHDTSGVIRRIRNHKFRIVMDSVLRSNSTLCYLAGLKFCGPYRFLFLRFMKQGLGPPIQRLLARGGRRTASNKISFPGSLLLLGACVALVGLTAYEEMLNENMMMVYGIPRSIVGFLVMFVASLFEHVRKRYSASNPVELRRSRGFGAISILLSGVLQLPLAAGVYMFGQGQDMQLGIVAHVFMILFIMTFIIMLRFYVSDIGKRTMATQIHLVDSIVSIGMGSALDLFRTAGACSLVTTCFALGAVAGIWVIGTARYSRSDPDVLLPYVK